MKFLIIGLGSMGKRRIRCLRELGYENIIGFDFREDRVLEVDIQAFTKFSLAWNEKPNVFLVCTPPDRHFEYMEYALRYNIPCFTEASVCIEGMEELVKKDNKQLIHPSATMRFNGDILYLKSFIDKVKCTKFEYRCCSYLPDWHPNENINDFYVSKKETGACREIVPFELEWLIWIFGKVKKIKGIVKSTGQFGEIDDIYQIIVEFESGVVGYILIDIITKEAKGGYRKFRFNVSDEKGAIENIIFIKEKMYVEEIKHFIEALEDEDYHYSLQDDIEVLKLLEEIEK